jgi:predicted esterase
MPGKIFRFGPTPEHRARHLFVFLHGSGATPKSMIPIAFRFQARFPSAALVVPSGFAASEIDGEGQQWYSSRGLTDDNRVARIEAILPRVEALVRREQTNCGVPVERTVLIGFSQGGTVALEAVKQLPGLAGAVVSRVHSERAARVLAALHVPVTLDIVEHLGHALSHHAICLGSLRLLQGIYEGRRATLH